MSTLAAPGLIRRMFRIVSPTCEDMTFLLSALLDGELPLRTRLRMRLHLIYCKYCRRFRDQLQQLRETARRLEAAPLDETAEALGADKKERLRRALGR